ncbi:MAG: hypothetical protein OQK82_08125, partial [Candidatus Pacearchaeota archaeon]|nr:hypothetical protein [Candidatus Pacearchaeota archaeon]
LDQGVIRNRFKAAFVSHFIYQLDSNGIPFLDITEGTFEMLYGKIKNPYISAYILYCYMQKVDTEGIIIKAPKPILSHIINEKIEDFNYRKLRTLTPTEGDNLGKATLRYINWGVEYTAYSAKNTIDLGFSGNKVFDIEQIENRIIEWIGDNDIETRDVNLNYLQFEPEQINTIGINNFNEETEKTHILTGYYDAQLFRITGRVKENKNMEISKIDLWESSNIAWTPGSIDKILIGDTTVTQNIDTHGFFDKKIFNKANETTGNTNVIINYQNNEATLGFEFTEAEKISAFILVDAGVNDSVNIKNCETIVYIKKTKDGNYTEQLKIDNIIISKDAAKPIEKSVIKYFKDTEIKVGITEGVKNAINLGYTYAGESNNNVNYIYFIFPELEDKIYGIKIVNKDTNENKKSMEISEIMVFNEDPIPYISRRKSDTILKTLFDFDIVLKNTGLSITDQVTLLFNKNPEYSTSVPDKIIDGNEGRNPLNWVDVFFRERRDIEQIVVWEDSPEFQDEVSDMYEQELFVLLDSTAGIIENSYYNEEYLVDEMKNLCNLNYFYTPFYYGEEDTMQKFPGNPLPYAAKGIDSPRTFAYKMYKQREARKWYMNKDSVRTNAIVRFGDVGDIKTTLASSGDSTVEYKNGYVSEMDIANALGRQLLINQSNFTYKNFDYQENYNSIAGATQPLLKPFLPGLILNTDKCIVKGDSLYQADKIAGVDSLGMVLGGFTMAGIDKSLRNLNGIDIKEEVSDYYRMNEDRIGLDAQGKPVFYPGLNQEDSCLESTYRLTRSDIEGVTVLVPDIKLIQPGDIIIKFNENNEAHIGIVIKTEWGDNYDNAPVSIDEQMNRVVVASIKKGFRMALIGTWGNPDGLFGGFAENPKEYHIRRFLVDSGNVASEEEDWELVKRIYTELVCTRIQEGVKEHWIPNTKITEEGEEVYERLDIGNIHIRGIASDVGETNLPDYLKDIKILSPIDYGFSE